MHDRTKDIVSLACECQCYTVQSYLYQCWRNFEMVLDWSEGRE